MAIKRDWFKSIFNGISGDNDAEILPLLSDWSVKREDGTMTRPAVSVKFLGTRRGNAGKDPLLNDAANALQRKEAKLRAAENKTVFDQAIELLSQSTTGRYLLEEITKEGYRIVFDDRRTGDRGAGGLCDPLNKLIVLKSSEDIDYVALVIGHEAAHALQHSRHDIFPTSAHTPETGINISFAIEADAYAHQIQIAFELSRGDALGPAKQIITDGPLYQMQKRFPDIVAAAERALLKEDALKNGLAMATAFEAFYDNPYLRSFYEDTHVEWCNMFAREFAHNPRNIEQSFNKTASSDEILSKLLYRGQPYVKNHLPGVALDDARHSGVSAETEKSIQAFYKTFKSENTPPVLKVYGTHMKNAVDWLFNRASGKNILILKKPEEKTQKKPQKKDPPKKKFG